MGKKELANTNARLAGRGRGYLAGEAEERSRCADIALDIWKKKPAKDAEWYKTVGKEIAAEILGVEMIGPFGILIEVDDTLEEITGSLDEMFAEDMKDPWFRFHYNVRKPWYWLVVWWANFKGRIREGE